ncbi:MAG: CBS domain-containing protein [Bacteroidia bacterium]|nr:CBS domain-containing protein [Bacteroidia bacterium]
MNAQLILSRRGNKNVYSIKPNNTVYEAMKIMGTNNIGSLLVHDENEILVGFLSERDYSTKVVVFNKRAIETKVQEIMTPINDLTSVASDTSVENCLTLMAQKKVRHLVIINNNQATGIISIVDILNGIVSIKNETTNYFMSYIHSNPNN